MRLTQQRLLPHCGEQVLRWNRIVGMTNRKTIEEEDLDVSKIVRPGEKARPGTYKIKLALEATYSSRTHFVRLEEKDFQIID